MVAYESSLLNQRCVYVRYDMSNRCISAKDNGLQIRGVIYNSWTNKSDKEKKNDVHEVWNVFVLVYVSNGIHS